MAFKIKIAPTYTIILFLIILGTGRLFSQTNTEFKTYQGEEPIELKKPNFKKEADLTHNKPIQPNTHSKVTTDTTQPKEKTLIYLEQTDLIKFDQDILPDIQVLLGNVILRHDNAYLYCDSAYLNQNTNSFKAFGHVKIEQSDSVTIFSKELDYNGNSRIAKVKYNVRMINGEVTLTTDSMTYDRNKNIGYYTCGGTLQDSVNTLVSQKGYYHTDTKLAEFKTDVIGTNENNTIVSDTLTYNTNTKIATIIGPTTITHSDSTTIYSELGWYNSTTDESQLLKNPIITHSEGKTLIGDTIFYDKKLGLGKAFSNVVLTDTTNSIILKGHYGYYQEEGEIGLMTDSAMLIEYSQKDTTYIHADTLYSYALKDKKAVHAWYNARLYQKDYQAISDSVYFFSGDSILHLMQQPVLWSDSQQITGDTITIEPGDSSNNIVFIKDNSIIIQKFDTIHFNQMSGKDMKGYIKNNKLEILEIKGNSESIFFPDDGGTLIGLNTIKSSYMTIYFKNGKLDRLNVFPSPTAVLYPMEQITDNMLYLPNFTWQEDARPISKEDIFRHPKRISKKEIEEKKQAIKNQEKEERKQNKIKKGLNKQETTIQQR